MKKSVLNQWETCRGQTRASRAFTLIELLVVLGAVAMLAAVLLSASFTTRERVSRAQCVSNLRQIGVGLSLYAAEANDYYPICGLPNGQLPWQTYEIARVDPADGITITRGYESLGLLFRTKTVPDPKTFYCPSLACVSSLFAYDYYTTASTGWPSTPVGSGDDNIRAGYNYYPQLRVTERVMTPVGYMMLPKLTFSQVQLEFGSPLNLVTPAKWTELDPKKSVTTDLVISLSYLSHKASGSVAGVNALFPDGRVVFQNARTDSRTGPNSPWDPIFWMAGTGSDALPSFRTIMNDWRP
jgi:prepilin-type N-terminal cleavage/methylation domain-containing protein